MACMPFLCFAIALSLPVLASVALAACSMALVLLAAATSFGSYLVGAVH